MELELAPGGIHLLLGLPLGRCHCLEGVLVEPRKRLARPSWTLWPVLCVVALVLTSVVLLVLVAEVLPVRLGLLLEATVGSRQQAARLSRSLALLCSAESIEPLELLLQHP